MTRKIPEISVSIPPRPTNIASRTLETGLDKRLRALEIRSMLKTNVGINTVKKPDAAPSPSLLASKPAMKAGITRTRTVVTSGEKEVSVEYSK